MNAQDRFRRVDALFREVSALPHDSRDAFLARTCAGETSILLEVRSLLTAAEQPEGVLDRPALLRMSGMFPPESSATQAVPQQVGRYRILRKIGEGGMGSVYEAVQEHPNRRVALKILRCGAASRHSLQRFQLEAEILGRLQHPGIAQIIEARADESDADGQPYIVMELVDGPSLLEYSRANRLDLRQRLELFLLVCEAVHFAHQHGVVHRDLKPANILVVKDRIAGGPAATGAQPKILDFGVARLTDADVATLTQHTTVGEIIGTVPYMSPEQAAGDPALLDWRSDVYCLGVILYELLTDRLPLDVRRVAVHEAVRVIREDDPTPAGSIDRSLRGDIETILAKALEKERERRYQSTAELAADIRRYLCEQPIEARPASALYRMVKFARRNRAVVSGVCIAFLALAVAAGVAIRQAIVAERARAEEHRLRAEAERQSYHACLVAGSSAIRRHEVVEARRQLDSAPASLRGWEWAQLQSRLDDSEVVRSTGFATPVIAISPDGRILAGCNSAGRLCCWRISDWEVVAEQFLTGTVSQRRIEQLVYSADGRELRADTRSGSMRMEADSLACLAYDDEVFWRRSPDGRIAIVDDRNVPNCLIVKRYPAGEELFRIDCREPRESIAHFLRDGSLLAICLPRDQGLIVFRCADGVRLLHRPDLLAVTDLCFNADGSQLGASLATGKAQILDTVGGHTLATLEGHETAVTAIDFSPRGDRVVTAGDNGTVRLWDAVTGEPLSTMHGNRSPVLDAVFTPDGAQVVTATVGPEIRWWNAQARADPCVLKTPQSVYGLAFSPDGEWLVAACLGGDGPLRMWDVATGRETFAGLDGYLSSVAFDTAGSRLLVGRSARGATSLIRSGDGSVIRTFPGHFWRTDWVGFTRDGEDVLSVGNGGLLSKHNIASGKRVQRFSFPGNEDGDGCRAALSPDRSLIAIGAPRTLCILDASSLKTIVSMEGHQGAIYALAFSADGRRLVSGGQDRMLRVWDTRTGSPIAELEGHSDVIFAAAFSPDGRRIVSGGRDRAFRVWDAERYDEITQLHGHSSYVYCLAFSPDGNLLASGGGDDAVRIWATSPYPLDRPALTRSLQE